MSDPKTFSSLIPTSTPVKNVLKTYSVIKPVKDIHETYILDPKNVKTLINSNSVKKLLKNNNATHKIIIENTRPPSSKLNIVKALVNQAKPHLIVPWEITAPASGATVEFFCETCEAAIVKLCADNLMLRSKLTKGQHLPITLIVGYKMNSELNAKEMLSKLLKPRVTTSPVKVNLEQITRLNGQGKKIYFDITSPLAMNFILNVIRPLQPKIINISHNNIETIKKWKRYYKLDSVDTLDLSFNQIRTFDNLGLLLRMNLKEIKLTGNPICKNYATTESYFQAVKKVFPTVEIIDSNPAGIADLELEDYFATSLAAEYLVDQFMEHYFTFYDNPKKRRYLQDIYHPDAIFTLTSSIYEEHLSSSSQKLKHHAHNLLEPKSKKEYSVGPEEIIRKICYLPQVEHEHQTFKVDILHYVENKCVMFIIRGNCRDVEVKTNRIPYLFSRTFMLLAGADGEFQIINDLLYVSNELFGYLQGNLYYEFRKPIEIKQNLPVASTKEEQDGFIVIFVELTNLHIEHARNFLERCQWNMADALETFNHEYRFDLIDNDYFIQDEIMQIIVKHLPEIRSGMDKNIMGTILENLNTLKEKGSLIKQEGLTRNAWRSQMFSIKELIVKDIPVIKEN